MQVPVIFSCLRTTATDIHGSVRISLSRVWRHSIMTERKQITVCVEGNIGSGKTTLLNHFSRFTEVETLTEPVEKWRDVNGHNLLDLMYRDPKRWSYMFQSYVQLTMLDAHTRPSAAAIKMMERSLHSGRHCFVENLYRSGLMADAEYAVLDQWYQYINDNLSVRPDLIVYLRSTPEVVSERVRLRSRSEERAIPADYLHALHRLHEDWLIDGRSVAPPCPVLVMDANQDAHTLKAEFDSRRQEILCDQLVTSPVKDAKRHSARATV